MNVGMLWLDAGPGDDLGRRLMQAVDFYEHKYGRRPNLCVVHPETAGEAPPIAVADVRVRVRGDALRGHFWIGLDDGAGKGRPPA